MRRTPTQVAMKLLLGQRVFRSPAKDLKSTILEGRKMLVVIAQGTDFGYDALAWHEYLWSSDAGGYKWSRRSSEKYARIIRAGMARSGWADAVRELQLNEQREAIPLPTELSES